MLHRKVTMKIASRDKLIFKCDHCTLAHRLLETQVAALKKLSHPHIVPLLEVLIDSAFVLLVSKHVAGPSVFDVTSRLGKLPADRARKYFIQIVDALDYCHSTAGIAHRSLNMKNVILTQTDDVVLAEVGHASLLEMGDQVCYNAPELFKREAHKSFQTDVWALAVCLYYMVEGTFPFRGSTEEQVSEAQTAGKYCVIADMGVGLSTGASGRLR